MKPLVGFVALVVSFGLTGCSSPPEPVQTSLEIQAYQSKDFQASKQLAFEATLSVLQDAGYVIESAEINSGFITGKSPTKSHTEFWYGATNQGGKVTATIASKGENSSHVRLNFVASKQRKSTWNQTQDVIEETPVTDPGFYQKVFAKIEEALFVAKATK